MPLRDIVLTLVVVGSLPVALVRPWIGILVWNWIGFMAPQWLTWGFASSMPFAQMVAAATLPGVLLTRDRQPLPRTREVFLLCGLWLWFGVTTVFAMFPERAWDPFFAFSKALLFVIITIMLFQDRARFRYLLLVTALSVGFYGFKGGLFALVTREQIDLHLSSALGGNTTFGLALVMTLPLLFYLAAEEPRRWLRRVLQTTFALCIVAAVFTYSRGAFLGLSAVLSMLMIKRRRPLAILAVAAIAFLIMNVVPDQYIQRTETIVEYQSDGSAMARILAWKVSFMLAQDRPVFGGGFASIDTDAVYKRYTESYSKAANAHSIWFNVLGEHGFPGLALFTGLIVCCGLRLRQIRKPRNGQPPPDWVKSYSHMLELTLLGYVVAGTFLSVAYLELFYHIVAAVIVLHALAEREWQPVKASAPTQPAAYAAMRVAHVWNRRLH